MEKLYYQKDIMLHVFDYMYGSTNPVDLSKLIRFDEEKRQVMEKIERLHQEIMGEWREEGRLHFQNIEKRQERYFKALKYEYYKLNLINRKVNEVLAKKNIFSSSIK
jgi:hypothetical protein